MESLLSLTMNQLKFGKRGWTKWGGGTGISTVLENNEWICQSCGDRQILELPTYIMPLDETNSDYLKVCSFCRHRMVTRDFKNVINLINLKILHGL